MHINTPPLNLLRSSLLSTRFTSMSLNPTRIPIRVNPNFPTLLPNLKHQSFALKVGFRALSTRSFRAHPDSGPMPKTPSSSSKSLIEDEDDLNNWVSSLRTSSLRSGALTEDEDDEEGQKRGRVKRGNGDEGRMGIKNSERFERGGNRGRDGNFGGAGKGKVGIRNSERFGAGFERKGGDFGRNMGRGRDGNFGNGREGKMGNKSNSRFGGGFERKGGEFERNVKRGREGNFGNDGEGRMGIRSNSRFGGGFERKGGDFERKGGDFDRNVKRGRGGNFGNDGEGRMGIRSSGKFERNVKRGNERDVENRGGRGRGRDLRGDNAGGPKGVVMDAEDDDEEDEGFGARKGKSVSDFVSFIGDEDSDEDSEDDESEEDVIISRASLFSNESKKQDLGSSLSEGSESYLSETRFDQCAINPLSLKAIKAAGYEKMTVVQEATLPVILKGKDVMAKARTGTGKTVAFLLPSIEVVLKTPPSDRDQKRPPILVLVVCPTRELATQAAAEANNLVKYHPSIGVQVVMGGTRLAVEQKRMQANPCQILVATPGRLRDHLENTAGFATRLMGIKILVLDEADHLLDMGFRKDIERIVAATPKERQTLLFSATIPNEVRQICHIALKRDHEYINTVQEGSGETHSQVRQMHLVAPLENQFTLLYSMLKEHISDDVNYKVLVFCTTAMVTRLVADLLGELNLNVREIHSRKPQSYRTRVSDEFRKSKGLILITSDVSARGVDYPDVTLVIQLGLPSDREQYIHRLGRTGRKGKEGEGVLLLAPWEEFFLNSIKDLPISKASLPMVDPDTRTKVERALSKVEMKNKEAAYQAWLGYYNSNKTVGRDKMRLVELANEFSRSMGLDDPPAISKVVIGKMGLKNVPGLRTK